MCWCGAVWCEWSVGALLRLHGIVVCWCAARYGVLCCCGCGVLVWCLGVSLLCGGVVRKHWRDDKGRVVNNIKQFMCVVKSGWKVTCWKVIVWKCIDKTCFKVLLYVENYSKEKMKITSGVKTCWKEVLRRSVGKICWIDVFHDVLECRVVKMLTRYVVKTKCWKRIVKKCWKML